MADKVLYRMAEDQGQEYPTSTTQQEYFPIMSSEEAEALELREKEHAQIQEQLAIDPETLNLPPEEINRDYLHKKIWEGLKNELKIEKDDSNEDKFKKIAEYLDEWHETEIKESVSNFLAERAYYSITEEDNPDVGGEYPQGKDIELPYFDREGLRDDFLSFLADEGLLYERASIDTSQMLGLGKEAIFPDKYNFEFSLHEPYEFEERDEIRYHIDKIRDVVITLLTDQVTEFKINTNYLIDELLIFGTNDPESIDGDIVEYFRASKDIYFYVDEFKEFLQDERHKEMFNNALSTSKNSDENIKSMFDDYDIPYEGWVKIIKIYRDDDYSYDDNEVSVGYEYGYAWSKHSATKEVDFDHFSQLGLEDTESNLVAYLRWYEFSESQDQISKEEILEWKPTKKQPEASSDTRVLIRYGQDEPIDYDQDQLPEMESGQRLMPVTTPADMEKQDHAIRMQEAVEKYQQYPGSLTVDERAYFLRGLLEKNGIQPTHGKEFMEDLDNFADGDMYGEFKQHMWESLYHRTAPNSTRDVIVTRNNGAGCIDASLDIEGVDDMFVDWLYRSDLAHYLLMVGPIGFEEIGLPDDALLLYDYFGEKGYPTWTGDVEDTFAEDSVDNEIAIIEGYNYTFKLNDEEIIVPGKDLTDKDGVDIGSYIKPYGYSGETSSSTWISKNKIKGFIANNRSHFLNGMSMSNASNDLKTKFLDDLGVEYQHEIDVQVDNVIWNEAYDYFEVSAEINAPFGKEDFNGDYLNLSMSNFTELGLSDTLDNMKLILKYFFISGIMPGPMGTKLGWDDFLKKEGKETSAAMPFKKRVKKVNDDDTIRENELSQSQENLETEKTNNEFRIVETR